MLRLMILTLLFTFVLSVSTATQVSGHTVAQVEKKVLLCAKRGDAEQIATTAQVFGFNGTKTVAEQHSTPRGESEGPSCVFASIGSTLLDASPLVTVYPALNPDDRTMLGVFHLKHRGLDVWSPISFVPENLPSAIREQALPVLDRVASILPTDKIVQTLACLYREDIELMVATRQVFGLRGAEALAQRMMKSTDARQPTRCSYVNVNLATIPPSSVVTIYPALNPRGVTVGVVEVPMRGVLRVWAALQFPAVPQPNTAGSVVSGKKP